MDTISGYRFSIVDSKRQGPCIKIRTGSVGRSYLEPISGSNPNLTELYESLRSEDNTDGTNSRLKQIGLVDENGDPTDAGSKLVDYMLVTYDPELVGLQDTFQEIDDKHRMTPTDGSGLDTNLISGVESQIAEVEEDHFKYTSFGCEERTLEALSVLEKRMRLYYIPILASDITGANPASESAIGQVTEALEKLEHKKYVEAKEQRIYIKGHESWGIVYTTTNLGKEYLKYVAGQRETGEDVQQPEDAHGPTEEEEPHTESICTDASEDSCDTLYSAVLGEFDDCDDDTLLKLNIDGAECPLLYMSLDKREGYPGAVYVRIGDENAYCAGYVNESDKLIISPEGMYALLVKRNVDNIRNLSTRKFIEVFDGLTGTFRDMMGDEMSSIALQLEAGTYLNGNVKKLVSGKRNLKPDGQLFVAALRELFETDSLPVVDAKGDEHTISPYNISKYIPKDDVEPENNSPESPENSQGGKMTSEEADAWVKKYGQ